jgi:hypothetical protein
VDFDASLDKHVAVKRRDKRKKAYAISDDIAFGFSASAALVSSDLQL